MNCNISEYGFVGGMNVLQIMMNQVGNEGKYVYVIPVWFIWIMILELS